MNEIAKIETEIEVIIIAKELQGWVEERGSRLAHLISRGEYSKDDEKLALYGRLIKEAEANYEEAIERLNNHC